ncbi:MAG TPA: FHA domain-containing protein [Propionibacteriaceae bacterium]|nr:FHA domain-containing protein [Propionibacteriaceae bacterium]
MPYCTHCGHDNPDGSNFCANCGAPLPATTRSDSAGVSDGTIAPSGDTTKTIPVVPEDRDADALTPEEEAAVKALPQGSALLVVQRGPDAGSRFLLNKDVVTAGRHQSSDIFLDDISVSRRHAVLVRTPEGVVVKDQGSLNGTYVNRSLVDECRLTHGDEVQIGKFRLVFFASPADVE